MSEILAWAGQHGQGGASGQFVRKELVGKGAYGGVYKGIHTPTGLVVALKVIDLDTPDDDIHDIQTEVALLSSIPHARKHNITLYHGSYLHGSELWIAMDFASGGSIRTLMKSGTIEEKYVVLILREVLVALSFLHKQGIIHRDVKAANVLLTQSGKILLCDFGVAAHLQTNNKRSTFIGTPLWMAPEVITDGKLYDTKADIWSLGVTLYEIATGNPPYFGMEPLRACALIPRSQPAKLEGGTWSISMREFLSLCLQTDPANRPTADELSRTRWIKTGSKIPMLLLRELIVRYLAWVQTGGQRASLAGLESLAREDTFELEEETWDFETGNDDSMVAEPLGDEPPRSLDQQAALSSVRQPKVHHPSNVSRNHPLLRLFDAETSPAPTSYSNILSSFAPAMGSNGMDTLRPTISIPSFEEMDEMAEAKQTKFAELPNDTISPSTSRTAAPFAWTTNHGPPSPHLGPPSPRFRSYTPDSQWGNSSNSNFSTPTEANFPEISALPPLVSTSPSLPSMAMDRPFATRNRSNTAPSFEYPPLGPGIPAPLPPLTHSTTTSVSSANSNNSLFSSVSSGTSSSTHFAPSANTTPTLAQTSAGFSSVHASPPPFRGGKSSEPRSYGRTMADAAQGDANRPFRSRTGSDAVGTPSRERLRNGPDSGSGGGLMGRPRTGSDVRPTGLHPKHGLKLQISTGANPLPPLHSLAHSQLSASTPPSSYSTRSANPFDLPTPTSASMSLLYASPDPVPVTQVDFPFPVLSPRRLPIVESAPPSTTNIPVLAPEWPAGPSLRPLDYAKLITEADVHEELALTIAELGTWLEVVDSGLARILAGTV